jgi:hypothetical protein
MTIDTHHLIVLSKDGSGFKHHAFDNLDREWTMFLLQRELYRLEKEPAAKPAPKPVASAKPRVRVKAQTAPAPRARSFVPGARAMLWLAQPPRSTFPRSMQS